MNNVKSDSMTNDSGSNNLIQCFFINTTFQSQYFSYAALNSSKSNVVSKDFKIFIENILSIKDNCFVTTASLFKYTINSNKKLSTINNAQYF